MKNLLIDVNSIVPYFTAGKVTGIGRTTLDLVSSLDKIQDIPFNIFLYSQNMKGIGAKNINTSFKCRHLFFPNRENWNRCLSKFPIREWTTGYDIMHIPHNYEHVYSPQRTIITLHDAFFMKIQDPLFNYDFMRKRVPTLIQKCKHIITCSEYSKKDIIETMGISPDKIDVIYWGIKHQVFRPCTEAENILKKKIILKNKFHIQNNYFFSVSCSIGRKRTDVLIKSFLNYAQNTSAKNDLVLIWPSPPQTLLNEIKNKGLQDKIHFLDNISDNDLAILYQGATALFFPSAYEGFGLPILEAMACGTPVVTSDNSSLREIGEDIVYYLSEENLKQDISQKMYEFDNGMLNTEYSVEKGKSKALQFTWEKTAKRTLSIYMNSLT